MTDIDAKMAKLPTAAVSDGTALTEIPTPVVATTASVSALVTCFIGGLALAEAVSGPAWAVGGTAAFLLLICGVVAILKGISNVEGASS